MSMGKMVTSLTGIVSRKGCMRLATETGSKMVDRVNQLGRNLNKSEVEQIFAETLPKSCRPKLITSREEVMPFLERSGYSKETAHSFAYMDGVLGMTLPNGSGKSPILIPISDLGINAKDTTIPTIAHELEHALERNNKPKHILGRKLFGLSDSLYKLFGKRAATESKLLMVARTIEYQQKLQLKVGTVMSPWSRVYKDKDQIQKIVANKDLLDSALKEYANATSKGSKNSQTFATFIEVLDTEIPAYTVGGRIEEKILGLTGKNISVSSATAEVYKGAKKNIKQNRLEYWKNKLLGRLGQSTIYQSDKDILRLAATKEEKTILRGILKDLPMQEKIGLFETLKSKSLTVQDIANLTEDFSKNGKLLYPIQILSKIKPEILKDQELTKYLKMVGNDGKPIINEYNLYCLNNYSKPVIENFKQLLSTAKHTEISNYTALIPFLETPKYEVLKKLIDAQNTCKSLMINTDLISDMNTYLSKEEISTVIDKLKTTSIQEDVMDMLFKMINSHRYKQSEVSQEELARIRKIANI